MSNILTKILNDARIHLKLREIPSETIISSLVESVSKLKISHVIPQYTSKQYINDVQSTEYIQIEENDSFSCGLFILSTRCSLELHSHPEMYGFIKILQGSVRVLAYNRIKENILSQSYESFMSKIIINQISSHEINSNLILSPKSMNLHSLHCIEGPLVFFDLLTPSYSPTRICEYFVNKTINKSLRDRLFTKENIKELDIDTQHELLQI